jgi:hypothetical protein
LSTCGSLTYEEATAESGGYSQSQNSSVIYGSIIAGYFITNGLSIEPELGFTFVKDADPGLSFITSLCYTNFNSGNTVATYVKVGLGISNCITYPNLNLHNRINTDGNVIILNGGLGLKSLISKDVYFRTELNFRHFDLTTKSNYGTKVDSKDLLISLVFGISVIL